MEGISRRALLASLVAGVVCVGVSGCLNPGMAYFLTPEQALPAKLKHLPGKSKKTEPKVLILTYTKPGEVPVDFIHIDRQLTDLLTTNVMKMATDQDQYISILPSRRVEEFKNANPDWKGMGLVTVGRRLGADYVVYLEINSISLYEAGSAHMLFRGRTNISVTVADVNNPDDLQKQDYFSCTFPSDNRGPVPVAIDMQPMQFRQHFLSYVARQLSWYFADYPRSDNRMMEPAVF